MTGRHRLRADGLTLAILIAGCPSTAAAAPCYPPSLTHPFAIPRPGTTNVPLATSITIAQNTQPEWPELTADGTPVPVDGVERIGQLVEPSASLWRIRPVKSLKPSTNYVLTVDFNGARVELTRFSTAAIHATVMRYSPGPKNLKLWRVRYSKEYIRNDHCVNTEYHGFVHFDYEPIVIEGTPRDSVIYTIHIVPDSDVEWWPPTQSVSFTADAPFHGQAPLPPEYRPGFWSPDLAAHQNYCAYITAQGFNDLAVELTIEPHHCGPVQEIDLTKPTVADAGVGEAAIPQCPQTGCQFAGAACTPRNDTPYYLVLLGLLISRRLLRSIRRATGKRLARLTMRWC